MKFLLKTLITAVNVFLLAAILPGIAIDNFYTAIIVSLVLAVLDFVLKPLLIFLTLPATILTFGLFLFVINAIIILIDAYLIGGFKIDGFWYALLFSMVLSFLTSFIDRRLKDLEKDA